MGKFIQVSHSRSNWVGSVNVDKITFVAKLGNDSVIHFDKGNSVGTDEPYDSLMTRIERVIEAKQ